MQKSFNSRFFEEIALEMGINLEQLRRGFDWSFTHNIMRSEQYSSAMIEAGFKKFIESGEYFLNRKHFGLEGNISHFETLK